LQCLQKVPVFADNPLKKDQLDGAGLLNAPKQISAYRL